VKHAVKRVLALPFRMAPPAVRRRAVQLAIHAAASRAPADALRELLALEEDVTGAINEMALAYGGGIHAKHRLMAYHDFFVERIHGGGQRVLDVGCGYGAVAYSIATRTDARVTGLDMSAAQVERAQARFRHPRLTFMVGRAPDTLPPGPFDIVVASNVLEHVDDRPAFLRTIQRTLAPRCWLIRVPMADRDWIVPLRKELGVRHFSDPTHFTEYTRGSFDAEMRDAGFAVNHLQVNWGEIWAEVSAIRS
jgi:ubiquinone/menaquinone biosynthesis C-methylase UbiE